MSETVGETHQDLDKINEKLQNDIARREARRRRILKNAKSRLDKLSGAERDLSPSNTNKCVSHSTETYSDPEIDHPEFIGNYNSNSTYNTTPTTPNYASWESSPLLNAPVAEPPTKFEKFLSSRTHIIAASAITYGLLVLGVNVVLSQTLFALFLTLECIELLAFRRDRPLSPIVNMVLMLSGLNIAKAGVFIKVFGLVNRMLSDLGLFVFVLVVSHGLNSVFVEGTVEKTLYSF